MTAIATAFLVVSLATYLFGRASWNLLALIAALFVLSPLHVADLPARGRRSPLLHEDLKVERTMQVQDVIPDATNRVLSWDLPDESLSGAFSDQAALLAGCAPEDEAD